MKTNMYFSVQLDDQNDVPSKVQLLRTGVFSYFAENDLEITQDTLRSMKKNFDEKVRGYKDGKLPIDYFHEGDKVAAGWIQKVSLEDNDNQLWIDVKWTKKGKEMISDGELRYLSAEFDMNYKANEGGKEFGATLFGGGLTNRPFVKGMENVVGFDEGKNEKLKTEREDRSKKYGIELTSDSNLTPGKGDPTSLDGFGDPVNYKFPLGDAAQAANARTRFKQFANQIYKQSGSKAVVHERIVRKEIAEGSNPSYDPKDELDALLPKDIRDKLEKPNKLSEGDKMTIEEAMKEIDTLKSQISALQNEKEAAEKKYGDMQSDMNKEKVMAEKKEQFDKMLAEGKVVEAQRESFMAGDTVKFAELSKPINLQAKGNEGDKTENKASPDVQVLELAEKLRKENSGMTVAQSISRVLTENKELREKYEETVKL